MIEALESRRLLSAVYYNPDAGSIVIHGTDQADRIDVIHRHDGVLVKMNGHRRWFRGVNVQQVDIESFGGDDVINAAYTSFRVDAFGGDGGDTILGGWSNDYLDGTAGADRIAGGAGDDQIHAGGGRDRVDGMSGNDTIYGEGNSDKLDGGAGDDYFVDNEGSNIINGADGVDWAVGFADRGSLLGIEGQSFVSVIPSADPYVHLSASGDGRGGISVTVTATHFMGGFQRIFGEVTRDGNNFTAAVSGKDLAGPDSARDAALHTEQHVYPLGELADGAYTFTAKSGTGTLATMTIHVSKGVLVNTTTWSGPYAPIVYLPVHAMKA